MDFCKKVQILELLILLVKPGASILVGLKLTRRRDLIVVNIRWDHSSGAFTRNIQACFINGSDRQICHQLMEVTLVGYIRGFSTKQNLSTDAQIVEQDKSIAEACLDLVVYRYHKSHA